MRDLLYCNPVLVKAFMIPFLINKQTNKQLNHFDLGCYAQRYGTRGYGHNGMASLGLMSDIKDKEWQRYLLL